MKTTERAKPLILQTYKWPKRLRYLYRQIFKGGKHRLAERFGIDFIEAFDLLNPNGEQMTVVHINHCGVCVLQVAGESTTYLSWEEFEEIRDIRPESFTTVWVYGDDLNTLGNIYQLLRAGTPLPVAFLGYGDLLLRKPTTHTTLGGHHGYPF